MTDPDTIKAYRAAYMREYRKRKKEERVFQSNRLYCTLQTATSNTLVSKTVAEYAREYVMHKMQHQKSVVINIDADNGNDHTSNQCMPLDLSTRAVSNYAFNLDFMRTDPKSQKFTEIEYKPSFMKNESVSDIKYNITEVLNGEQKSSEGIEFVSTKPFGKYSVCLSNEVGESSTGTWNVKSEPQEAVDVSGKACERYASISLSSPFPIKVKTEPQEFTVTRDNVAGHEETSIPEWNNEQRQEMDSGNEEDVLDPMSFVSSTIKAEPETDGEDEEHNFKNYEGQIPEFRSDCRQDTEPGISNAGVNVENSFDIKSEPPDFSPHFLDITHHHSMRTEKSEVLIKSEEIYSYYSCKQCSATFREDYELEIHRLEHTKSLICRKCEKPYATKGPLIKHLRECTGEKEFVCHICKRVFHKRTLLEVHSLIHENARPFMCTECDNKFACELDLLRHKSIHSEDRPFQCDKCYKAFKKRHNLELHSRTHSGIRPYPCPVCGRSFSQKSSVIKHLTLHTGLYRHVCVCKKSFKKLISYKLHIRKSNCPPPFACDICKKWFVSKRDFQRHICIKQETKVKTEVITII